MLGEGSEIVKLVQNLEFYVHLNDHQFESLLHWLTAISARDETEINERGREVYERYYDANNRRIAETILHDRSGEWQIWFYNPDKDAGPAVTFYWPGNMKSDCQILGKEG